MGCFGGPRQRGLCDAYPAGTVYWTIYTYDGIGRTTKVKAPDGASTTTYAYAGANVTTTDPAGKWKTFTTDAVGNLTVVQEPDPNLGTVTTNYSYDTLNHLTGVSMPRGSTTQTRSFSYQSLNPSTGAATGTLGTFLITATNPENGTVTNYYNADTTLAYKIDAKGQKIAYTYDGTYKRVTQISKFPNGTTEDICQRVNYYYDGNPDTGGYPFNQYTLGRLASLHYAGANCSTNGSYGPLNSGNNYIEMFGYTQAGQVMAKDLRLVINSVPAGSHWATPVSSDLLAYYTYDSEGKMLTQSYPLGDTYTYTYDSLGRSITMTDTTANSNLVTAVTYNPDGTLANMTGTAVGETRSYNANGQVTQINVSV